MNKECLYTRDEYILVVVLDFVLESLMLVKFPSDVKKCLEVLQDTVTHVIDECEDVYYE